MRWAETLLSAVILVCLAPVIGLAAVGIKASSPGPILYRARRIGYQGSLFDMYKLRTMHVSEDGGAPVTARGDARVFWWGRVLRKLKIDELPQLLNVVRGQMRWVGPRPEAPEIVQRHYGAAGRGTLEVLPGVTCLGTLYYYTHGEMMVGGEDPTGDYVERVLPDKLALDCYYVRFRSTLLDLRILVRTIRVIALRALGRVDFPDPPELSAARAQVQDSTAR
jgi:lipopolysaccharide/colanic/teichoic acid biosynthesis glycosyltransferase